MFRSIFAIPVLMAISFLNPSPAESATETFNGSDSRYNFAGYFSPNRYNDKTFYLYINGAPTSAIGGATFTLSGLGDFSESIEYMDVWVESFSVGRVFNNQAGDDVLSGSDIGRDSVFFSRSTSIPISSLLPIISNGVIAVRIKPSDWVDDTSLLGNPEEYLTAAITYNYSVVPVPPAVWLFGSALGVMGWMRRTVSSWNRRMDCQVW